MVPPPSKRGARTAALLLLVLTPLASWLLSGRKQAVQCRSGLPPASLPPAVACRRAVPVSLSSFNPPCPPASPSAPSDL